MASIFTRVGLSSFECVAFRNSMVSWNRFSMRYFSTRVNIEAQEASETARKTQTFISPELKRELLEKRYQSEQPKKYIFDCLPEQGSPGYNAMMRSIFQELRKHKTPSQP